MVPPAGRYPSCRSRSTATATSAPRATSPPEWDPRGGTCARGRRSAGHERGEGRASVMDPVRDPVRFIDQRTAAAPLIKKAMRYLFPDHWSFLLGEVALYSFIVLVATGIYLTLSFDPRTAHPISHGPYQ